MSNPSFKKMAERRRLSVRDEIIEEENLPFFKEFENPNRNDESTEAFDEFEDSDVFVTFHKKKGGARPSVLTPPILFWRKTRLNARVRS